MEVVSNETDVKSWVKCGLIDEENQLNLVGGKQHSPDKDPDKVILKHANIMARMQEKNLDLESSSYHSDTYEIPRKV